MAEQDREKKPSRRNFIKGLGVGAAVGIVATAGIAKVMTPLTSTTTTTATNTTTATTTTTVTATTISTGTSTVPLQKLLKAGVIEYSPERCVGCQRCMLACASVHGGAISPQLSRIMWIEEFVGKETFEPMFCKQCDNPLCYWACPKKDQALSIDEVTGARYINTDNCIGCQSCIRACPYTPPRINFDTERKVSIKCDLCMDRPNGPACIEVCSNVSGDKAISFVKKEERQ
jgi:Fe-S-cluster-containing dehydrogenase component